MGLTALHVRGKRKPSSSKFSNLPKALQPLEQQHTRKKAKRSMSDVMAAHSGKERSNLDTLPSEILEKILLYSQNLSLPHASPVIGAKLSERATLIRLLIWAFHETWDQWFGVPTSTTLLHGPPVMGKPQTKCHGDHVLQTAVLKQPWAKIDYLLQAQQTWADNNAYGRWFQHSIPWNDEPDELGHSHHGGPSHYNAHKCFDVDYSQATNWSPFRVESMAWGTQDIHPKTRIPEDLITGPWDEEQTKRLFWLARGGMLIASQDFDMPPWEMKIELLRNAVLNCTQPNMIVINCLIGAWVFQDLPGEVVRKELNDIDRRIKWGDDTDLMRTILQRTRNVMSTFQDYRQMRRSSV